MKYDILKFEAVYGPPMYRVRLKKFPWGSWVKGPAGILLNFETKEAAHEHMRTLAQPMVFNAPDRAAA